MDKIRITCNKKYTIHLKIEKNKIPINSQCNNNIILEVNTNQMNGPFAASSHMVRVANGKCETLRDERFSLQARDILTL